MDAEHAIGGLAAAPDGSAVVVGFFDSPYFDADRPDRAPWTTVKRWKLWH